MYAFILGKHKLLDSLHWRLCNICLCALWYAGSWFPWDLPWLGLPAVYIKERTHSRLRFTRRVRTHSWLKCRGRSGPKHWGDPNSGNRSRWNKKVIALTLLKAKIAKTLILKHFDPDRPPVIVVYASKWAVSAALLQEYDGIFWPVTFSSRTPKSNEVNHIMVEKEVLALLRILDICYTMLVSRETMVFTRYSTSAWLLQSSSLNGRIWR